MVMVCQIFFFLALFNPRPFRPKGIVVICVCLSVCPSVSITLVNTITQSSSPINAPNLQGGFIMQTCQPLRILRNHYAFRVSNTPLRKPVQNVGKLRILRNFGAIRPILHNIQQLSWLAISRKSPAGRNKDKDLFIL